MNRTGVIVAVESYLLRKGIIAVLNRIPGISVKREFDTATNLEVFLHTPGRFLLIISHSIFSELQHRLFQEGDLQDRCIILDNDPAGKMAKGFPFILAGDSKTVILGKIQDMLDSMAPSQNNPDLFILSPREKTIVRHVSLGYTNKQIAEELFLSVHTVITHRKNIAHKLGIKSVSGLTVYAIVNNIITIEELSSKPL